MFKQKVLLLSLIAVILMVLLTVIGAVVLFKKNKSQETSSSAQVIQLSEPLVVFSRCLGSGLHLDRTYNSSFPKECVVHLENLGDPESNITVKRFIYNGDSAGNWGGLRLYGILGDKLVYSHDYYTKQINNDLKHEKEEIGTISLPSGKTQIIESFERYSQTGTKEDTTVRTDSYIRNVALDEKNKRVFYQTVYRKGPGLDAASRRKATEASTSIKMYPIETQQLSTISSSSIDPKDDVDELLLYVRDGELYLTTVNDGCMMDLSKFSPASKKKIPVITKAMSATSMQVSSDGKKAAYVSQGNDVSGANYVQQVHVIDLTNGTDKVIDKLRGKKIHDKMSPCGGSEQFYVSSISPSGKLILYEKAKEGEYLRTYYVYADDYFGGNRAYTLKTDTDPYWGSIQWLSFTYPFDNMPVESFSHCYFYMCSLQGFSLDFDSKTVTTTNSVPLAIYAKDLLVIPFLDSDIRNSM